MKRAIPFLLLASLGALGCGVEFEEQSTLTSLRVLGVRKDKPYAKPGDTVALSILYDDAVGLGADAAPPKRDVEIMWISACENPAGDSYLNCLPAMAKTFSGLQKGIGVGDAGISGSCRFQGLPVPIGIPGLLDCGVEYSFKLRSDIIARHAPPKDKSPRYGLAYVFFLLCGGEIGVAPAGQQFPLACYSKSGKQLGADDFVVGYTAVYAYESITNANPLVKGFSMGKDTVPTVCIDEACIRQELPGGGMAMPEAGLADASLESGLGNASRDAGSDAAVDAATPRVEGGASGGGQDVDPCQDPDAPTCFEVCTAEKQKDCPEHEIKLETDPSSVEPDDVTKAREGRDVLEQAWIDYYTEQGEFVHDVKLLGDANEGYHEDHGTTIRAPKKLGPFKVWGVAHDSRGGVGWAEVRLATRPAK